jgi:hypothetical protein
MTDEEELEQQIEECSVICGGKVHHDDDASAREHAKELGGAAYFYDCACPLEGEHFHVASSPIRRKDRDWIRTEVTDV